MKERKNNGEKRIKMSTETLVIDWALKISGTACLGGHALSGDTLSRHRSKAELT